MRMNPSWSLGETYILNAPYHTVIWHACGASSSKCTDHMETIQIALQLQPDAVQPCCAKVLSDKLSNYIAHPAHKIE